MPITPKQQLFVKEYLVDLNATQAAIRAGYSVKTAGSQAHDLLKKPEIQEFVSSCATSRAKSVEITAEYVLATIRNTIERCAQAEKVVDKDGSPTGEYKFDSAAVLKGSELLGKYLKLFTDKTEVSNPDGTLKPAAPVYQIVSK